MHPRDVEAGAACFVDQLGAHTRRRVDIREEHRPERDVRRSARDQLERVASVCTPPIPTIGSDVARRAAKTAASATGFSAGPGVAADTAFELRRQSAQSSATPRSVLIDA